MLFSFSSIGNHILDYWIIYEREDNQENKSIECYFQQGEQDQQKNLFLVNINEPEVNYFWRSHSPNIFWCGCGKMHAK